ncbi:MAG: lysozyme [Xenococcaceae cyanobacterium MO_188.B32]|nr:lysozyme [Xenococcaceae cyanobacterium MO_188.B32]
MARKILDLPKRPKDSQPYTGWLGEPEEIEPDKPMAISNKGIALIKRWEGFRDKSYLCPGNVWTIGYGHTGTAKKGMCITRHEAEVLLRHDLRYFEAQVVKLVKVDITQNQFDALVSFAFNVGVHALSQSTLLRRLNQQKYDRAANEFERWIYAAGKKLPGLVSRRQEEKRLFLS